MPSRSSASASEEKMSWKDQLSPRFMGLRGFRRASESAKMKEPDNKQFTMMHFPDRPVRRITEAEIPSEEECKKFLINMRKASFAEQLQRRQEHQPLSPSPLSPLSPSITIPEPPMRPAFRQPPFRSTFGPLTPAEEEENPLEFTQETAVVAKESRLQVPTVPEVDRSSAITDDGFNLTIEKPVIIEAKQVKLERVDNVSPGASPEASPTSTPRPIEVPQWPKRKQSVQMVAIQRPPQDWPRRKQSVQTVLIRRPSRAVATDALSSHPFVPHTPTLPPIHCHVRQDSASDLLCRVCHVGLAEKSGVCSNCGDEQSVPTSPTASTHDLNAPAFSRPHFKQPQQLSKKPNRPPPLASQSLGGIANVHRPTPSVASDPEGNQLSPPASPRSPCSPGHTVPTVVNIPAAPPTPLSALSTPEVFKRFQQEMDIKAKETEDNAVFDDPWAVKSKTPKTPDVYEDDWADYYFDEQNFDSAEAKGDNANKVTTPVVQGFMQRELSLDEYDRAFASPVSPGPGWI